MEDQKEKDLVASLRPKSAFKAGLISGLAIMFVVGFFVLLGVVLTGNSQSSGNNITANNKAPNPTAPNPTLGGDSGTINIQPVSSDDWVKGDKNAKISIIEFSDTECPFCKRFHSTMNQVLSQYDGQVNWIYRHFPLTSLHPNAAKEAEATECAGELGGNDGFWAYTDRLFEITPSNNGLQLSQLPEIAGDVGLDVGKFQECLDSSRYASKVQDHGRQAQTAGGRGTPYSVILAGDQKVPVNGALPFEQVKSMLDALIN